MLLEIYCDKFLENGNIRPAIEFHNGLNVVLGDELGANSIGKSTFLLVVDFVFGGDDYVKKALDIIKNVGEHTIFFVFEFNHIRYYFSRSTQKYPSELHGEKQRHCPCCHDGACILHQE